MQVTIKHRTRKLLGLDSAHAIQSFLQLSTQRKKVAAHAEWTRLCGGIARRRQQHRMWQVHSALVELHHVAAVLQYELAVRVDSDREVALGQRVKSGAVEGHDLWVVAPWSMSHI